MASAVSYFHYSGLSENIQSPLPTALSQNKTPVLPWPPFSKSQFHENRQEYADLSANVKKAAPKGRKITPSAARGDVREYCYLFDFAYPFTEGSGSAPHLRLTDSLRDLFSPSAGNPPQPRRIENTEGAAGNGYNALLGKTFQKTAHHFPGAADMVRNLLVGQANRSAAPLIFFL